MSAFPATRSNQAAQVIKFLQKHMLANHLHQYPRITKPDLLILLMAAMRSGYKRERGVVHSFHRPVAFAQPTVAFAQVASS